MGGSCAAVSAFAAEIYVLILCLLPVLFAVLVVLLLVCPFVLVARLGCVGFVFTSLCLLGLRYPQNAIFPGISEDFNLFFFLFFSPLSFFHLLSFPPSSLPIPSKFLLLIHVSSLSILVVLHLLWLLWIHFVVLVFDLLWLLSVVLVLLVCCCWSVVLYFLALLCCCFFLGIVLLLLLWLLLLLFGSFVVHLVLWLWLLLLCFGIVASLLFWCLSGSCC